MGTSIARYLWRRVRQYLPQRKPIKVATLVDNPAVSYLKGIGRLTVGVGTYGDMRVLNFANAGALHIGNYCSIAKDATFFLGGNHHPEWVTTYPFTEFARWPEVQGVSEQPTTKGDIYVGSDVWIGNGAVIMSGVTIGHGAVVGARAVVAKNIPPYAIAVGNPALVIRTRFSDAQVKQLLQIAWWDWEEAKIRRLLPLMVSSEIDEFIRQAQA